MEYEILLLITSVFLLIYDFFQLSRNTQRKQHGIYASTLVFALILIAYSLLVGAFLTNDFSLIEVYSYSSSSLSSVSKICASWAGSGGSILLLSLLLIGVYFAYRLKIGAQPSRRSIGAAQVLNIFALFFILMDIGKNPFARFSVIPPDGAGLNPALQTPWMMVHPPIVFAGYAFILLAFASILGGMKTREFNEDKIFKISFGVAWLLMTAGIAIGGVWAYEVLGWGGYWSWDPVETGSLLVWLGLTAYFFVRPLTRVDKSLTRQFVMLVTFGALIFLSALTRGGLLRSVHAYALSPAGPILLGLGLGFTIYFFYLKRKIAMPLFKFRINKASVNSLSVTFGFFALVALFLVSLFGVVAPILGQLITKNAWTPDTSFYNNWSFPFAFLLVLSLVGITLRNKIQLKRFIGLSAFSIIIGAVLAVMETPTSDPLVNFGLPVIMITFASILYDLALNAVSKERTLKAFGRNLLFFGMILGLIGIAFSAAVKQQDSLSTVQFNNTSDEAIQTLNAQVNFKNYMVYGGCGQVYNSQYNILLPEYSRLKLDIDVQIEGRMYHDSAWMYLYSNYGAIVKPTVLHTIQGDFYLHLEPTESMYNSLIDALFGTTTEDSLQEISFTAQSIPMINLLWIGVAIMCTGISLGFIHEFKTMKKPQLDNSVKN